MTRQRIFRIALWIVLFLLSFAFIIWISGPAWVIWVPTLIMIGLHECGHLYAAKRFGLKTGGFYFVPGLGGVALLKEFPKERWKDFWIFYAGPLAGLAQVLVLLIVNIWFQWPLLGILAGVWSFINLFNLLPALPLDGGKIMWSILSPIKPSEGESYFRKWEYYLFTMASLIAISVVGGLSWVMLILILGWLERKALMYQELSYKIKKIPMTTRQFWHALGLYFSLSMVLLLITFWTLIPYIKT
ncbi:MAG: site-2 protease family protein [Patescibacteria group bacterium]